MSENEEQVDEEELADEEDVVDDTHSDWTPPPDAPVGETVFVETGRGMPVEVRVGAPFVETVRRIASDAHYGGYFRTYLNGSSIDPDDAPETIDAGMRIVITSYEKVG